MTMYVMEVIPHVPICLFKRVLAFVGWSYSYFPQGNDPSLLLVSYLTSRVCVCKCQPSFLLLFESIMDGLCGNGL